jgi:hypothetical protein
MLSDAKRAEFRIIDELPQRAKIAEDGNGYGIGNGAIARSVGSRTAFGHISVCRRRFLTR